MLVADADVHGAVSDSHDIRQIREKSVAAGMMPLRVAGAEKVARGETTLEEVMRVAPALDD